MHKQISIPRESTIPRRIFLAAAGAGVVAAGCGFGFLPVFASQPIGSVVDRRGKVTCRKNDVDKPLMQGNALENNDLITTGDDGFAELALGHDTRILLGADTEVMIDTFLADQGGTIELVSGQMIFDRPVGLPKIDLTLRTAFGQIGVRGTKFFCGVNRGNYAVFVEHGAVDVMAGAGKQRLGAGEGVDIAHDTKTRSIFGGDISPINAWNKKRIAEAYKSVGLEG